MAGKRLNYVDMAKGIAILTVVFYHLTAPGIISFICTQMIACMLAVFFFFSGFFYRPGKRSFAENLKARAKALLIPFFKYSLIFWLAGTIYLVATGGAPFKETLYCLRNFFGGCIWNRTIQGWFQWEYYSLGKRYLFLADFWFLIAMFFSSVVFFPVADAVLHSKSKTLLSAAALFAATGIMRGFGVTLIYNFQLVPFWTAFMLLGAYAGTNGSFEIKSLSGAAEWIAAIISLGAGIAIAMLTPANTNVFRGTFAENEVINMMFCIISSILTIWGMGELCKLTELAGVRVKELTWLGSHTMTVYIYHMFIAWLISIITGYSLFYDPAQSSPGLVLKSLLFACVVLAVCIMIAVMQDRMAHKD